MEKSVSCVAEISDANVEIATAFPHSPSLNNVSTFNSRDTCVADPFNQVLDVEQSLPEKEREGLSTSRLVARHGFRWVLIFPSFPDGREREYRPKRSLRPLDGSSISLQLLRTGSNEYAAASDAAEPSTSSEYGGLSRTPASAEYRVSQRRSQFGNQ